nr:hypothetical protein [Tanacetum cinerariifolium]
MIGNKAYLVDYQDFNGGPVAFGGSKGQIIVLIVVNNAKFFQVMVNHHTTNGHQFTMSNRQERIAYSRANSNRRKLTTVMVYATEEKPTESERFAQIIDFLNGSSVKIQALVDGKRVNIKKSFIRRTLRLDDAEGTSCLTNIEIFEGLAKMGAKTTSWNEFSSTMASAIICLATNQKFNFSRYIQLSDMAHHKEIFDTPSLTKKVFANMKRVCTGFSREVTSLFDNMLVQAPEEVAEQTLPSPSNDPLPSGK